MTVFEELVLMIAFATLVYTIAKKTGQLPWQGHSYPV